jgi:hypothetical protein
MNDLSKPPQLTALRFSKHLYEVRPRKDKRGFDLISDVLPFGRLCDGGPNAASNTVSYAIIAAHMMP